MKCFNHHDKDAVGICKSCNKGLCPDCAVDVGNGIACKGTCQNEVIALNTLIEANNIANKKGASACSKNIFVYGTLAFIISGIGLMGLMDGYRELLFLEFIGLFMFFLATINVIQFITFDRINSISKKN